MASAFSKILLFFLLSLLIALCEQRTIDKTSIADPATRLLNQFSKVPKKSLYSIYYNDKIILAVARENSTQNIKSQVTFNEYDKFLNIPITQCGFEYIEKNENVTNTIFQLRKQWQLFTVQLDRPLHYSLMYDELKMCRSVDAVDSNKTEDSNKVDNKDFCKFSFGFLPGTKWCGKGDIASGFHDLGQLKMVDICCRDHDLCTVSTSPNCEKNDLFYSDDFTKSNCDCDYNYYKCLKDSVTPIRHSIESMYLKLATDCYGKK